MSWKPRRAFLVAVALLWVATLSLQHLFAQRKLVRQPAIEIPVPGGPTTPKPPTSSGELSSSLKLPVDEDLKGPIEAAREHIANEDWPKAINWLQKLLKYEDTVFAPVYKTTEGQRSRVLVNVRVEANNMIANLPPRGLDFYKLEFGPNAKTMLENAKTSGDYQILGQIMRNFLYTDSGVEATELLGTFFLDRGSYTQAALCFERLFRRVRPSDLSHETLLKAAIAFQRGGDSKYVDQALSTLEKETSDITLGEKTVDISDVKKWVKQLKRSSTDFQQYDWPWFGGSFARSGQGKGGTAYLHPTWETPTYETTSTKSYLTQTKQKLEHLKQPILPAYFPIAATTTFEEGGQTIREPLIIYRTFKGLEARMPKTGELWWRTPHSDWSIARMGKGKYQRDFDRWFQSYTNSSQAQRIIETSLVGSLSTDNRFVFAVEDFYVPPYIGQNQYQWQQQLRQMQHEVRQAMEHNKLQAYELASGKLIWEIGGSSTDEDAAQRGALVDCFFLGPPLPMGGKLYAMMEKKEELYLVTLEPETGKEVSRLRLAITDEKMAYNIHRRANAVHLAYGDGIMVCPTNAGGVLGIDLMTKDLIWMYEYRETGASTGGNAPGAPIKPFPGGFPPGQQRTTVTDGWKSAAPVIQNGRLVIAPPDGSAIHCINLRNGAPVWRKPRGEGLYLAGVFNGKVVVVGKNNCVAYNLEDGSVEWDLDTGEPSGRGVASNNVYYLPLREGKSSRLPEICAIDMEKGLVQGRTIARPKKPGVAESTDPEIPGNLLFYEGQVISQNLMKVTAFPQLAVQIEKIDTLLAKRPNDPEVRYERGTLRLYKGDLGGAIEDLQQALSAGKLPADKTADAQARLYETFTEYFQRDFVKAERFLDEYKAMCKVVRPDLTGEELLKAKTREKIRLGNFYCLLGKGRESQRRWVDAYEAYMNFARLGQTNRELMSVVDEPYVRANPVVWAQGRIAAMAKEATPEERKPLEELIQNQFVKIKSERDLVGMRSFVSLFGSIPGVGREARRELAKQLMQREDPESLVEADRHLGILRDQDADPQLSAQAVEMLANLMIRKEMMEDAAYYFELLGTEYKDVVVRDGLNGSDLYRISLSDKRMLPYMDEPQAIVKTSNVKVKSTMTTTAYNSRYYQFEPQGDNLPFFRRYKLVIRTDGYNQFKVLDRFNNQEYWSLNLPRNSFNSLHYGRGSNPPQEPRYPFFNLGHLVVLQAGYMVYGLDPVNKKKLWEVNLAGPVTPQYQNHTIDPRDGSVLVYYRDGWMQRLGGNRALSPKAVCLQTHDALIAVHPVTGKTLWSRNDLARLCHLYNDSQHLFVVEINKSGAPGRARVLRVDDGVEVKVKDYSAYYSRRLQMFGRTLLFSDSTDTGDKKLRLYDVLTGKDIWSQTFAKESKVLVSEVEHLTGVVEPNGKVTLIDLKKGKQTVTAQMKPEHLKDIQTIRLVQDRHYFYLACDGTANAGNFFNRYSNLMPNTGMRWIPVNGHVYSFDNKTGKRNWYYRPKDYENDRFRPIPQMMVLEQFKEMPAVIFTTRFYERVNVGSSNAAVTEMINKKTGKLIFDEKVPMNSIQQVHTITVNPTENIAELISYNRKLTLSITPEKAKP